MSPGEKYYHSLAFVERILDRHFVIIEISIYLSSRILLVMHMCPYGFYFLYCWLSKNYCRGNVGIGSEIGKRRETGVLVSWSFSMVFVSGCFLFVFYRTRLWPRESSGESESAFGPRFAVTMWRRTCRSRSPARWRCRFFSTGFLRGNTIS